MIPVKRALALLLTFVLLAACAVGPAAAAEGEPESPEEIVCSRGDGLSSAPPALSGTAEAAHISKYGNVYLSLTCDEVKAAGYAYGDLVTLEFLGQSLDLPFCSGYSDVDSGSPGLFAREEDTYVLAAVNMGDFATAYGIAVKTTYEDKSYSWAYAAGVQGPVTFTVTMKEAGGYYDEYVMHRLSYTDERGDYPGLSDGEFANFRAVETTGMGRGILYRSSSPVNPEHRRNAYADAELRRAGVTAVINLADSEAKARSYEGYAGSYYSAVDHIALSMAVDISAPDFGVRLAEGLRFMAETPGVYAIICNEGKDRSGLVCAVLECFMGAGYEEVIADYMRTYYCYYGVTEDDPRYETIASGNIVKNLQRVFAVADLKNADLAAEAEGYLKSVGLTEAELSVLKTNLSVSHPFRDVAPEAWYAEAVARVYEKGLMIGTGEETFSPDGVMTRAQLVTVLWRLAGEPEADHALPADVPAGAWYAEAVRWAVAQSPLDTVKYTPDEALTREEAVALLWREARCLGEDVSVGEDTNILSYNDGFDIGEAFVSAMQWAVGSGILEGDGRGNLSPGDYLTRAQAAAMLLRFEEARTRAAA